MATSKQILRTINQDQVSQINRREAAKKEYRELKQSIISDSRRNEVEKELPELDGLVTKSHLRHARRVVAEGKALGETIDRLPIHQGKTPYHQKGHRVPRSTEFEAQLLELIKRYGPEKAADHFSLGQHTKYEQRSKSDGSIEFWNVNNGEREFPVFTVAERLVYGLRESLKDKIR